MKIIETAASIPAKTLTNKDLESMVDTTDEWISKRTGIKERRIAVSETTASMASDVASQLLEKSGVAADEVRLIIVASMSANHTSPSLACQVQSAIGASQAICFDIAAACSGFVYSLSVAEKLTSFWSEGYAIIIGSEKMSSVIDWTDRTTCVLFGDGAGGVLAKAGADPMILAEKLQSDGDQGDAIVAGGACQRTVFMPEGSGESAMMSMKGKEVYNFATRQIPKQISAVLAEAELTAEDVDYFVLHQANVRILAVCARKLKIDMDKVPTNIDRYGNTSAASVPIVLNEMRENGQLPLDGSQTIILSAFGGGLTWASLLVKI